MITYDYPSAEWYWRATPFSKKYGVKTDTDKQAVYDWAVKVANRTGDWVAVESVQVTRVAHGVAHTPTDTMYVQPEQKEAKK